MARILLSGIDVDFPVFTSRSRGFINTLFLYSRTEQRRLERAGAFRYQVHALRGIDLTLDSGDRIGLIGKNGAGKTTLLRVLSGVYEPTRGIFELQGRLSSLTDITLGMDMDASGYENIVLRGIVLGLTRRQAIDLIPEVEAFCELGEYLQLPVGTYSSGMMLRLAFAISTAVTPDILLMDEMINAGDASFLHKAEARLLKLMEKVSILVLASHNDDILRRFCNKGLLLHEGRILHCGSIDECFAVYSELG